MTAVSGKEFCRLLEHQGWELKRINGSHHIYKALLKLAEIDL